MALPSTHMSLMENKLEENCKREKERIYSQKRHLEEPTESQGMLVNPSALARSISGGTPGRLECDQEPRNPKLQQSQPITTEYRKLYFSLSN